MSSDAAHERGPLFSARQRATLLFLAIGTAIGGTGLAAGGTAGALLGADLAGSNAAAGLPLGLLVVGSAAAAPLISYATPRIGRAVSLALGYLAGAAGAAVVISAAVVESLALLLAGSVLVGAANSAIFLTRYAAADAVGPHARGRALGFVFFATALGAVASPLLLGPSGDLAQMLGLPRLSGLYGVAFVAFGLAALLLAVGAYVRVIRVGQSVEGIAPREQVRVTRHDLAVGLRAARPRTALLVLGTTNLIMVSVMAIAPVHLTEHDHNLAFVGAVISMHVAGMFGPSPLTGWLADRVGTFTVGGVGFALLAAAGLAGALMQEESGLQASGMLVLLGLGWNFGVVGGSTLLSASTTPRLRPHAEGIGEVVMGIAAGIGAPVAGILVAGSGFSSVSLAAAAVAIGMVIYLRRSLQGPPAAVTKLEARRQRPSMAISSARRRVGAR
jgi:MFS family permease